MKQVKDIRGIIFDLDGVLVNTDRYHYQAWKQIADKLGVYFDETVNNRLRGVSRMDSLEIILENYTGKKLNPEQKARMAEGKNRLYRGFLENMTPAAVSAENRRVLEELREKGYRLALGSSSKNAGFILNKVELMRYFDAVSDGNHISRSKPDPEVFLKAAEYLKLPAWQCAVVEDACAGIDAALAGGMTAIGIGDAAGYEKAHNTLECLEELLQVLEEKRYD